MRRRFSFWLAIGLAAALPSAWAVADAHIALEEKLQAGDRSAADRSRDAGRKPAEVLTFLGVEPGMTVLDLIASSGWYTEVLSVAVGSGGKVYAQNSGFVLQMREGANEKAISARLAGGRLPNVERLDQEVASLALADASVDAAITALNFHDIYNGRGAEAAAGFLASVWRVLKPGGVLGIIDHVGQPAGNNQELHRMDPAKAEAVIEASEFVLEARGEMLRNADDDGTRSVFAEGLRGSTDRFVYRLRKPAE